jgi:hypothetical protein
MYVTVSLMCIAYASLSTRTQVLFLSSLVDLKKFSEVLVSLVW